MTTENTIIVDNEIAFEQDVAMGGVYAGSLETGEVVLHSLGALGPPTADIFKDALVKAIK